MIFISLLSTEDSNLLNSDDAGLAYMYVICYFGIYSR